MTHHYGDSHQRLSVTPSGGISKPREGLCVTCKHHGTADHPFLSSFKVHGAQFLTCKVRTFRSVINGEESDWCHDIRRDNAACAQWENDRSCVRCKHAFWGYTRSECHHPSMEQKFDSGEFKGQSYWPDQRGHHWEPAISGVKVMSHTGEEIKQPDRIVYDDDPTCGKDAPLWEIRS